jgi:hypothetical protein
MTKMIKEHVKVKDANCAHINVRDCTVHQSWPKGICTRRILQRRRRADHARKRAIMKFMQTVWSSTAP